MHREWTCRHVDIPTCHDLLGWTDWYTLSGQRWWERGGAGGGGGGCPLCRYKRNKKCVGGMMMIESAQNLVYMRLENIK